MVAPHIRRRRKAKAAAAAAAVKTARPAKAPAVAEKATPAPKVRRGVKKTSSARSKKTKEATVASSDE